MTINEKTLSKLFDNIVHLQNFGFIVNAAFAQDIEWKNRNNQLILLEEIHKLCEYYISNPDISVCSILDTYLPSILIDDEILKKENTKWCGTGTNMVAIDIKGNEYPCQIFLPNTMPKECNWAQIDFRNSDLFSNNDCKTCLIRNICGTCYGINIRSRGDIAKRDLKLCDFKKILSLGASYLLGKKFELGYFGKYDTVEEKLKAIEAIEIIQDTYSLTYKL
jgi:radical SAM protein with 4Fe4S-binding SPASM domain